MKKILFTSLFLILILSSQNLFAQTPEPSKTPPIEEDNDVVKIDSNLVQLDAVVTDKDGKPITDLTKDDFEIWQDGKLKTISNFSFVNTVIDKKPQQNTGNKKDKSVQFPPNRQRQNRTGRLVTFVVDDGNCSSSTIGMRATRRALVKFVNEQMFPNDLVAIYRTRSGSGLLQQYTSDKSKLLRIAKKIRWYPLIGCDGIGSLFKDARQFSTIVKEQQTNDPNPLPDGVSQEERNRQQNENLSNTTRDNQLVGTLGVIRYIIRGLDKVAGRKVVFLMSDGFQILSADGKPRQVRDVLQSLTEEANRAAVVLNTIDVRGVVGSGMITAADDIKTTKDFSVDKSSSSDVSRARRNQFESSQDGMAFLAYETGGRFYRGNNDLAVHLNRAMRIEKGYYLLGYEPDDQTFRGAKFHKIEIKLKDSKLKMYSRSGFIGKEDSKIKRVKRTEKSELYEAILAPLPSAGLDLRLTAFYENSIEHGSFVRSLIHIEGKDIKFINDKNALKKAVFDVIAVTLNEKNDIVDEFNRTHTIRIDKAAIPFIQQNGLAYSTFVNVQKSGVYNFRVAIRDVNSNLVGSAIQTINIPKMKNGKIYLSGLTIGAVDKTGRFDSNFSRKSGKEISLIANSGATEIRKFKPPLKIGYSYTIYNAKLNPSTGKPDVSVIMNLYKNGELISEGKPKPVQFGLQSDLSRAKVVGYLRLSENLEQGDYVLHIIAKDLIRNRTTSQWIDFEVID